MTKHGTGVDGKEPGMRAVRRAGPGGFVRQAPAVRPLVEVPSRLGSRTAELYCERCGQKRRVCRCEPST